MYQIDDGATEVTSGRKQLPQELMMFRTRRPPVGSP